MKVRVFFMVLALLAFLWPLALLAAPCETYEPVKAGDVSPCDGIRGPASDIEHLLAEETRVKELEASELGLRAEIIRLRAELAEARGIAEAERRARIAAISNAGETAACVCDAPWGGWPWVAGFVGFGLGGAAGYGIHEITR